MPSIHLLFCLGFTVSTFSFHIVFHISVILFGLHRVHIFFPQCLQFISYFVWASSCPHFLSTMSSIYLLFCLGFIMSTFSFHNVFNISAILLGLHLVHIFFLQCLQYISYFVWASWCPHFLSTMSSIYLLFCSDLHVSMAWHFKGLPFKASLMWHCTIDCSCCLGLPPVVSEYFCIEYSP